MKILVLYSTQTGQLKDIVRHFTADLRDQAELDFAEIKLVKPYAFPWTAQRFFDVMPECVLQIPEPIHPMPEILEKNYDLIVFGYQPWFLSPSIPTSSFLRSEWARVLSGKKVVTLIGCRNMWLNGQEKVKADLKRLGAELIGNIVLEDRHGNLTSLRTTINWLFSGKKQSGSAPEAGVTKQDMEGSRAFGRIMFDALKSGREAGLQDELLKAGALQLHPGLVLLEKRGGSRYPVWANRARELGPQGSPERLKVIKKFQRLLMMNIFVLSPIVGPLAKSLAKMKEARMADEMAYFKGVGYREGML
jgi:hypothetical protein